MNKPKEANVVDKISKNASDIDLTIVISEVNLVGSNPKEWWIDIGATTMYAWTRRCFPPLNHLRLGKMCLSNSATLGIKGQGKAVLKMTFGKELTLTNVLYVTEIRKNLESGSLLNNHGFRLLFESNNFVLSKSGMYVWKWYVEVEYNDCN